MPEVTVIIPVFNGERYLAQCLDAVVGQSLRAIEIICINDNSSDESGVILHQAQKRDSRIRVLENASNLGAAQSRNRGIAAAKGRYIRFMDADDLLPPASTEVLYRRAIETGSDVVRGSLALFENDDLNSLSVVSVSDRMTTTFKAEPSVWVPWWHTSYLMSSELIRANHLSYPSLRRGEDPVFLAGVLVHARQISLLEDVVYLYRRYRKTTGSNAIGFADVADNLRHAAMVESLFRAHHPESWQLGYGPFLLKHFRSLLKRCQCDARELEVLRHEMEKIWGPDACILESKRDERNPEEASRSQEREYWNRVFARPDPWNYGGEYERQKYRHTLELMPDEPVGRALEIGCAEGMFTELLAAQVGSLLAVDISEVALERAKARCAKMGNVSFAQHDIGQGVIGGDYDLVVCAEVLYYLPDYAAVEHFARQVSEALRRGGQVLLTHGNMVSDDKATTGFDFHSIGAKSVAAIFGACPGMEFLRELRTELYRVQLFRRVADAASADAAKDRGPREVSLRRCAEFNHPTIKWGGCTVTAAEARHCWVTTDVPVLMYHRVARDGPTELAPYRVSPDMFERQLAWLQRHGYHGLSAEAFCKSWFAKGLRKIPGKPIVLTFDDAYADFYENAWPLLRRYGFPATVFVPTDYIGGSAGWDSEYGPPARIMSWEQIVELHGQGVQFGSHGCRHQRLPELTRLEALDDCVQSKRVLQDRLGTEIAGYCYPYAFADATAKGLVKEAGYRFAVGGRAGKLPDRDDPFYIPRIEIFGSDTMDAFIAKLPAPSPSEPSEQSRYRELLAKRARSLYMGR